mgnify:CR=1 FL=1
MNKYWFIIIVLFNACIDHVQVPLPKGPERLVVFGWITSERAAYQVKLSKSTIFEDQSGYPAISNASVYVSDSWNNHYAFEESDTLGTYKSDPSIFQAQVGQKYQLHISIGNEEYVSEWETIMPLSSIDYAFISHVADPNKFEIEPDEQNYYVSAFVHDDPKVDNFFRWKIFVDNELRNLPSELSLFNDTFTNGNRSRQDATNVLFVEGRQIKIRNMSITRRAFEYFDAIQSQADNSTFSPRSNPAAIIGNIRNVKDSTELILGYFGVSQVEEVELNP